MKLSHSVGSLPSVGNVYRQRLEKLGIISIEDLLHHIPHRYQDYSRIKKIKDLKNGDTATVHAELADLKNVYTRSRKKIQFAIFKDDSGQLNTVWFNQPYIGRNLKTGQTYSLSGKIDYFGSKLSLVSPEYERLENNSETIHTGRLVPVYPATFKVSSKWLRSRIAYALERFENKFEEFLPQSILTKYRLTGYPDALKNIHFPLNTNLAEKSKERLAFNEFLFHQLTSLYRKKELREVKVSNPLTIDQKTFRIFRDSLPFKLTKSQERSVKEIFDDLNKPYPMNRLLEGDVGSGKTAVAAAAAFCAFSNGCQSVFMAPTQILALQHFQTLKEIFDKFKVRVTLVTSSKVKKELGKTDLFVGTHALIHKSVDFDKVALVVIDEQQRFGVEQRAHLIKKTGKKRSSPTYLP